jgi:hypothetical protein
MDDSSQPNQEKTSNPAGKYGKRPLRFWVLLYIVIAIIVYGIIYLIFFRHTKSNGSGGYSY